MNNIVKFVGFVALLQILLLEILYKVHHYFRRNANFTAIHYDLFGGWGVGVVWSLLFVKSLSSKFQSFSVNKHLRESIEGY